MCGIVGLFLKTPTHRGELGRLTADMIHEVRDRGRDSAGVATFATQSAGCEHAAQLAAPLLLLHGAQDRILGPENSEIVRSLAGQGEIKVFEGADHLLAEVADELRTLMATWIPERFAAHRTG